MDYFSLESLRRAHPAWRLLTASNASLIISFLYHCFIRPNTRAVPHEVLAAQLDDHLFQVHAKLGDTAFPKAGSAYLDDWSSNECAWLRKFYPPGSDEPHYDITPATEKVIDWLSTFRRRQFVGTESRLMTVLDLLHQMTEGMELDPVARIAELEKRKAQIEADIARIRGGQVLVMDATQVRERFSLMASTARSLLSDFREVEENFRELDRSVRERIATWEQGKGALLEDIFRQSDIIAGSDQGKSFRSFWDFVMSPERQDELSSLLEAVLALEAVKQIEPDRRLSRIHYDWLEAGEVAQRTVSRLSEQLRRYLDDQAFLENRRIMQLIRSIEQLAIATRNSSPQGAFYELDDSAPEINLPLDRPLFSPPFKAELTSEIVLEGNQVIAADALFEQVYIDKVRLESCIRMQLQTRRQISLGQLIEAHPLEQGLAEVVAYMSLAAADRLAVIDDTNKQTLSWVDKEGSQRQAVVPLVVFTRATGNSDDLRNDP